MAALLPLLPLKGTLLTTPADNTPGRWPVLSIKPLVECEASGPVRVFVPRHGDLRRQNMIRPEARRDGHGPLQTEPQQTRPGQQNHCQRDLRHDKAMAQALSGAAGRSAASLRLDRACQRASEVEPRDGRRECESHDDGSENRDACQASVEGDVTSQG